MGFPGLCGPWGGFTADSLSSGESLEPSSSGGKATDVCSKVHAEAVCDAPVSQGMMGELGSQSRPLRTLLSTWLLCRPCGQALL